MPNCMVNPTAPIAITARLTSPNPNAAAYRLIATSAPPSSSRRRDQLVDLRLRQRRHGLLVALGVVLGDDVPRLRVVVAVEPGGASGADEAHGPAAVQRADAV